MCLTNFKINTYFWPIRCYHFDLVSDFKKIYIPPMYCAISPRVEQSIRPVSLCRMRTHLTTLAESTFVGVWLIFRVLLRQRHGRNWKTAVKFIFSDLWVQALPHYTSLGSISIVGYSTSVPQVWQFQHFCNLHSVRCANSVIWFALLR